MYPLEPDGGGRKLRPARKNPLLLSVMNSYMKNFFFCLSIYEYIALPWWIPSKGCSQRLDPDALVYCLIAVSTVLVSAIISVLENLVISIRATKYRPWVGFPRSGLKILEFRKIYIDSRPGKS